MTNLGQRILTAVVFATIGIAAVVIHRYSLFGLVLLLQGLTLWEFYSITRIRTDYPDRIWRVLQVLRQVVAALTVLAFVAVVETWLPPARLIWLPTLWLIPMVAELYTHSKQPVVHVALHWAGLFYITLPFCLILLVPASGGTYEPFWIIALLLLIWANDVFAYFTGRAIGGKKLFPSISPHKTVAGFVGGALATLAMGVGNYYLFGLTEFLHWLSLAGLVVVFGTLGDLSESMLKRNLAIKDSGTLLPGHGGFLDRFDGLLFVLPPVTAYILTAL